MSIKIALYKPEIPPNTGNIARLCVAIGAELHIVDKPSFDLSEKAVRRAGLDYWEYVSLHQHKSWEDFIRNIDNSSRIFLISKFGKAKYTEPRFQADDWFVFGQETKGLPKNIINNFPVEQVLRIPMENESRSLNLSNAVAIVAYESLRQINNW